MNKGELDQQSWMPCLEHWKDKGESPFEEGLHWRTFLQTLETKCGDDDTLWAAYTMLKVAYENACGTDADRKKLHQLFGLNKDPRRTARDFYMASLAQIRMDQGVPTSGNKESDSAFSVVAGDFQTYMKTALTRAVEDRRLTPEAVDLIKQELRTTFNETAVSKAYYKTYRKEHPHWQLMADPAHEPFMMLELWDLTTTPR